MGTTGTDERTPDPPGDGEEPSFRSQLRREFRAVDLVVLAVPAAVLLSVFRLPMDVRRSLAFRLSDPTAVTAFTAKFTHFAQSHLLSNLLGYVQLVTVAYLLALSNGKRTRFLVTFGVVLAVFPVVLSYLELAMPGRRTVIGFSGLNMAFLAYAIIEYTAFVQDVENAPAFFFAVVSFVLARYAESTVAFLALGASVVITALYLLPFLTSARSTAAGAADLLEKPGYAELAAVATVLIAGFVVVSFPRTLTVDAGVVNVYSHLLGFAVGFIAFYTWSVAVRRRTRPRTPGG